MAIFDPSSPSSPSHYPPSQTIVLLADFHSLFLALGRNIYEPAADKAAELRVWAKSLNISIVHGLVDTNLPIAPFSKDQERTRSFVKMAKDAPDQVAEPEGLHCTDDSEAVFSRAPGYVAVQKSPGFTEYLVKYDIKSIILAGISTSGCVLRTTILATEDDYVVTVVADACADSGDRVHEILTKTVLPMRAHVASLEEVQKNLWEATE